MYSSAGAQTLNGVSWTMAGTGGSYFGYDGTKGQQFGSGSKPYSAITLTTSGISGTISSIVVNTSGASSVAATVSCSVGGNAFGTQTQSISATATNYTFSGSASGEIILSWAQTSSKAIYVKSITVTYSATYSVTYDANGAISGTVPVDETVYNDNDEVTVLGNTGSLVKTGCTFGGWNTNADGSGTTYAPAATFEITDNTTLYAKWDGNLHTLTLPAEDEYGVYTMDVTNDVPYGTEVTLTYTNKYGYSNYVAKWYVNGVLIAGNTFTMPDEDVTVTVDVIEKPDYATLPFAWEGGASATFTELVGVSTSSLGSDYAASNTPYLMKFSATNDYIQFKTDGQPGKVIIGVKMIGGSSTSSFSVQESADGTSFTEIETLTISGTQNSVKTLTTTKAFAADTRYVKLVFTKGSNVGVGPISIYKSINDATDYTPFAMNGVNLTVYREFVAGWNGIVLPFDLTNDVKTALGATDVRTLNDATESAGTITLEFADAALPVAAGTPVLVKLGAELKNPSFEDVDLKTSTPTSVVKTAGGSTFTLAGTYSSVDLKDSEAYFVSNDKFYHKAAGVALTATPFRAYIEQTGATPARLLFNLEDETTGIVEVRGQKENARDEYFNLAGQRVAQPTRGLYIVNGKKIVIK